MFINTTNMKFTYIIHYLYCIGFHYSVGSVDSVIDRSTPSIRFELLNTLHQYLISSYLLSTTGRTISVSHQHSVDSYLTCCIKIFDQESFFAAMGRNSPETRSTLEAPIPVSYRCSLSYIFLLSPATARKPKGSESKSAETRHVRRKVMSPFDFLTPIL